MFLDLLVHGIMLQLIGPIFKIFYVHNLESIMFVFLKSCTHYVYACVVSKALALIGIVLKVIYLHGVLYLSIFVIHACDMMHQFELVDLKNLLCLEA